MFSLQIKRDDFIGSFLIALADYSLFMTYILFL